MDKLTKKYLYIQGSSLR